LIKHSNTKITSTLFLKTDLRTKLGKLQLLPSSVLQFTFNCSEDYIHLIASFPEQPWKAGIRKVDHSKF